MHNIIKRHKASLKTEHKLRGNIMEYMAHKTLQKLGMQISNLCDNQIFFAVVLF